MNKEFMYKSATPMKINQGTSAWQQKRKSQKF